MRKKTTKDIIGEDYLLKSGMNMGQNNHVRYFYINIVNPCTYKQFMKLENYDDYRLNLIKKLGFNDWHRLW